MINAIDSLTEQAKNSICKMIMGYDYSIRNNGLYFRENTYIGMVEEIGLDYTMTYSMSFVPAMPVEKCVIENIKLPAGFLDEN